MFYRIPLSDEANKAYLSMPKDVDGCVRSLFYVPPGRLAKYTQDWREWCKTNAKYRWPAWIEQWSIRKKQEKQ